MRKSRAEKSGEIQIHNIILNFPALYFLVRKIKEWEIQDSFCRSLPYFSIYPGKHQKCKKQKFAENDLKIISLQKITKTQNYITL